MRISTFRTPSRKEAPEVTDELFRYLSPAFRQIGKLTDALQRKLTLQSNFNAEVRILELFDDMETEIGLQRLRGPVQGVILLSTGRLDYARLAWEPRDVGRVAIKVKWDNPLSGVSPVKVLFLGADI